MPTEFYPDKSLAKLKKVKFASNQVIPSKDHLSVLSEGENKNFQIIKEDADYPYQTNRSISDKKIMRKDCQSGHWRDNSYLFERKSTGTTHLTVNSESPYASNQSLSQSPDGIPFADDARDNDQDGSDSNEEADDASDKLINPTKPEKNVPTCSTWADSEEAKSSLLAVLSALYALVLVILSLAFEVSIGVVKSTNSNKYDVFYIYLFAVALLFFAYCEFFLLRSVNYFNIANLCGLIRRKFISDSSTSLSKTCDDNGVDKEFLKKRKMSMMIKRKASHSASSAGSLYLRMGCVLFGLVGLIMKGLQLFAAFDGQTFGCSSATWVAETILGAVFIFSQMFFIFQNPKLIIHKYKAIGRLGAMHLVATNLCLWIRSLIEEQTNIMEEINHGEEPETHEDRKHNIFDFANFSSPAAKNAALALCASSGVRYGANTLIADVEPFMTTCIIEYSLICAAVMYILWRNIGHVPKMRVRQRKQRFHVDCTASSQGLFLGLLFMVYTIVSMVIFFTKVRSGDTEEALCVFYTAYIVLFSGSIAAIAVAMYRMRRLYYSPNQKKNIILLDDILLIVGLVGQLIFCVFSMAPLNDTNLTSTLIIISSLLRMVQVLWQTVFIFFAQRLATLTGEMQQKNPGREMVTFLLMTNLALFLINTFESQKAGTIPKMFEFDGEKVWMAIAHSTIPLVIFYRFHSTVCLAEIWKQVYRVKDTVATV